MSKVPITRVGYYRLLRDLLVLRRDVRPAVLEELQEARAFGVRLDNQQYLAARERHVVLQRRIMELEQKLALCEIVVGRKIIVKQAGFGAVIRIRNMDTGETASYELVGPYESNVSDGKLSIDSPVGRCLMGRREGEEVTVYAPSGMRIYRILSIEV
ncbi:MAG: GreA/GreB family elongation factor [Syntrophobacteraceae bacterium]